MKAGVQFRMPAEWEPHEATWLAWPHKKESWPGIFERIPPIWRAMVRALRESEEVRILVIDSGMEQDVLRTLDGDLGGVKLFRVPTDDAWIRDYGPIFVRPASDSARIAVTGWGYNAWGGKYAPWDFDQAVASKLGEILGLPVIKPGMILEGGSIDVDGQGTLLTTEGCLLHPNRNPHLGKAEIETRLEACLGAEKVLWLGQGIVGDDTDGHVDDLTRFVAPGKVVTAVEENPEDENYIPLHENLERLSGMEDARGRRLVVVPLPMPTPVFHDDVRCPASYANFLIANTVVLVPTFRSARDEEALGILRSLFPSRRVVGIDCYDLVWGLGGIHCVTHEQPAPLEAAGP